jgi:hypothetical protein
MMRGRLSCGILAGILAVTQPMLASAQELPDAGRSDRSTADYFPPPESQGGWRKLASAEDVRQIANMDPAKLESLKAIDERQP